MRIDGSQRWVVLVVAFLLALGGDAAMAQEQNTTIETLVRFDQLDFDAFSKQDWTLFNQIHCGDVKVVLPDGHETRGIKQHQSDMAALFVGTPDLRVSAHPVSFTIEEWALDSHDPRDGGYVHEALAHGRQGDPANRQQAEADGSHARAVGEWLHRGRTVVLG